MVVRFLNEGSDNAFRAMNKGVSKGDEINIFSVEQIEGLKDFVDKFKADSKKESKVEIEVMAGGETEEKAQPKKGNLRKSRFDKVDEEIKKEKIEFDKLAKETSKSVVDEMMDKIKEEMKKEEIKKEKSEFDKAAKETSKSVVDEMMDKIKQEIKKGDEDEEEEEEKEEIKVLNVDKNGS